MKFERILLTKRPLEVTAPQWEESYHAKENLGHLMKEHTRGWQFCCLNAHDTFGSFIKMLFRLPTWHCISRPKDFRLNFE
jgi:hypothetical protein